MRNFLLTGIVAMAIAIAAALYLVLARDDAPATVTAAPGPAYTADYA